MQNLKNERTKTDLSLSLERIFKNPLGAYYFEANFGKKDYVKSTILDKFEALQHPWGLEKRFRLIGNLTFQDIIDLGNFIHGLGSKANNVKAILIKIDKETKSRINKPVSGIIFESLYALKRDMVFRKEKASEIKKSWQSKHKKLERKKRGLFKTLAEIFSEDTHHIKECEILFDKMENDLKIKYNNFKGKEKVELNTFILTIHYILNKYAGYAPTAKASTTVAKLLELCNISESSRERMNKIINDYGNKGHRKSLKSHVDYLINDKPEAESLPDWHRKYIKPILEKSTLLTD